jgi:flagellar protein FliS
MVYEGEPMSPQDAYLESKVLAADPLELVCLLYSEAGDAIRRAQAHLAGGHIAERSREITRALAILWQLSSSLDHARGGAVSRNLAGLYDYMQRRLLEANFRQQAAPLAEVEKLLATLLDGWKQIKAAPGDAGLPSGARRSMEQTAGYTEYGRYPAPLEQGAAEYASASWSF